ncbi:MAG: nuclear transport factor 2 family protein [Burkholderiales bacterium]|nr:nuclear transport factor 2 family protein [Burkholderiales bacterium]
MDTSDIPAIFHAYVAGLKAHDVTAIAATMRDDLRVESGGRVLSKAEFVPFLRALYAGFPDWTYDHDPIAHDGDLLAITWRQSGHHRGTFAWPGLPAVPATGRFVRIPEQVFRYRCEPDGLVLIRPDPIEGGAPGGILRQIGVEGAPI